MKVIHAHLKKKNLVRIVLKSNKIVFLWLLAPSHSPGVKPDGSQLHIFLDLFLCARRGISFK